MDKKFLVLIGDNSLHYGAVCARLLKKLGLDVVLTSNDGMEIFRMIRRREPDIVVMDYFSHHIDAVGMMTAVRYVSGRKPEFIITSAYDHNYIKEEVNRLGAVGYRLVPFDLNALCHDIAQIARMIEEKSLYMPDDINVSRGYLENFVTQEIRKIGVPAHLKGYFYIREALILMLQDSDMANMAAKVLYPAIAKKFNTTAVRVERSIRNAIEILWNSGNHELLERYFPNITLPCQMRPSNFEFLATLADEMRLVIGNRRHRA